MEMIVLKYVNIKERELQETGCFKVGVYIQWTSEVSHHFFVFVRR